MPAKAGIHLLYRAPLGMDSRLRGNDKWRGGAPTNLLYANAVRAQSKHLRLLLSSAANCASGDRVLRIGSGFLL